MNNPRNNPRFITILRQAEEQCKKEFDPIDMHYHSDIIVKFFASGMEYRLSNEHNLVERSFLSSLHQVGFLMGYLQGKGADDAMIKEIVELARCNNNNFHYDLDLVDYFRKGVFYEESILSPNKKHDI